MDIASELAKALGRDAVLADVPAAYLRDETETRGLSGCADAVVLPHSIEDVARVVAWCYGHDVAITPRGGGTGFAGGAVPLGGGVVLGLERLATVRRLDPLTWRMEVEAGATTATVRRRARENGLLFPPDPGAAEQSQIGGNIATNAGGPHAFKYGVTGAWVTGLEAVIPPGEIVRVGGPIRKDVAGYDLKSLLVGSEGTLGVITAAWLRLIPAVECSYPVVAFFDGVEAGCAAIEAVLGSGILPAALEFADAGTLAAAGGSFPVALPRNARFMVLTEGDGSTTEAAQVRSKLIDALSPASVRLYAPEALSDTNALWRWRDGVSIAVTAYRGAKASEDIVVPVDRLAEAIEATVAIGARHGLGACSWGHAGDGNLHSTFQLDRGDAGQLERTLAACRELFELAVGLGGSISGEHGVGVVKNGELARQWAPAALDLHDQIKAAFDPKGLMNPGKKLGRCPGS